MRPITIAICARTWHTKGSTTVNTNMFAGVFTHRQSNSFWSLLKRGIIGNFHHVSKKYLPLYLNEFSFRFNNRKNPDIFDRVIAGC